MDDRQLRWRVEANAKVNLSLDVGPRGEDGYHPYVSWATSIGLADVIELEVSTSSGKRSVVVSTGLEDTLVGLALDLAARAAGVELSWRAQVEKRIPPGSGLGGGSADAAAALVAVAEPLGIAEQIEEVAREIGTDVPFCVRGGCARLHGRGELVDAYPPLPPVGILVAVPPVEVSTAEVFAAFDELPPNPGGACGVVPPAVLARRLPDCSFRNDLEAAALRIVPELADWKTEIEGVAGHPALMTGSGSAFVCLADRPATFDPSVVARLRAEGIRTWVTTPVPRGAVAHLSEV